MKKQSTTPALNLPDWFQTPTRAPAFLRQLSQVPQILSFVHGRDLVVDGGAHVGAWSLIFAANFIRVEAFEPLDKAFDMLRANMSRFRNVNLHWAALGEKIQRIRMYDWNGRLFGGFAQADVDGDVIMTTIDSQDYSACDLLKLDLEGGELQALHGAENTIEKFRPAICIERKGEHAETIHEVMGALDYKLVWRSKPDCLYLPRK